MGCTFDHNSAVYGGAFYYVAPIGAECQISTCRFANNRASLGGGAIIFRNVAAPLVSATGFKNNTAFMGGAIFVTSGAGLILSTFSSSLSPFESNTAFDGGAIFGIGSGTVDIHQVLFVRNKAQRNGGAVCLIDATVESYLKLTKARMYNNSAATGGALYVESVSAVHLMGAIDKNAAALGQTFIPRNEFFG